MSGTAVSGSKHISGPHHLHALYRCSRLLHVTCLRVGNIEVKKAEMIEMPFRRHSCGQKNLLVCVQITHGNGRFQRDVPTRCKVAPDKCIVVVHRNSTWYLEAMLLRGIP